jgi:hypothetical protein
VAVFLGGVDPFRYPLASVTTACHIFSKHTHTHKHLDDIFPEIGGCRLATHDEIQIPHTRYPTFTPVTRLNIP